MRARPLLQALLLVSTAFGPPLASGARAAEPALSPPPVDTPAATTPTQADRPPQVELKLAPSRVVPPDEDPIPEFPPHFEARVELLNLYVNRSDSDFDRKAPKYNENTQAVGAFATILTPKIAWELASDLHVYWESEVGLNYWSKNNPDQENAIAPDVFVWKQREIYAEGAYARGTLGYKVGYQYFTDPTSLFLGHWIGVAQGWTSLGRVGHLSYFVGQMPDQTYEGITIQQNNFKRDIFVFGARVDSNLTHGLVLRTALTNVHDASLVGHTRWVLSPSARVELHSPLLSGFLDGALQYGRSEATGLGGIDQTILAWAAQGHIELIIGSWDFALNALALSADDAHEGNDRAGAFLYSSKSKSSTVVLTEDEHRNWYDQLDRRMARYQGGFWTHRAGLMVADLRATLHATEAFHPALIAGASAVLNPDNALGNRLVGVEADVDLGWFVSDLVAAHVLGGVMVPGRAGAALINQMDLSATSPIYTIEAALKVRY